MDEYTQAVCDAVDLKVEEVGAGTEARLERLTQEILSEVEPKLATVGESMKDVQETLVGAMEAAAADAKLAEEALRTELSALRPWALQKRAETMGVNEVLLDNAEDRRPQRQSLSGFCCSTE